jgi:hypothetical protein
MQPRCFWRKPIKSAGLFRRVAGNRHASKDRAQKRSASCSYATVQRTRTIVGKSATYAVGILILYFYINLPSTLTLPKFGPSLG